MKCTGRQAQALLQPLCALLLLFLIARGQPASAAPAHLCLSFIRRSHFMPFNPRTALLKSELIRLSGREIKTISVPACTAGCNPPFLPPNPGVSFVCVCVFVPVEQHLQCISASFQPVNTSIRGRVRALEVRVGRFYILHVPFCGICGLPGPHYSAVLNLRTGDPLIKKAAR